MSNAKILVVDDEIIIARDLEVRLRCLGYEVVGIASSGREALALIEEEPPNLVLMDIVLKGGVDGIETAAEIRKRCAIPIIYLTAFADEPTLRRAKVTEPYGYLVKPFSERELRANIEMALYKHEAESKQRNIEKWFAASMRRIADAVTATDSESAITFINPMAEILTGWTREDAIGRKASEVFTFVVRGEQPKVLDPVFQALSDGFVTEIAGNVFLLNRRAEEIPIDYSAACLRDQGGTPTGAVLVIRDLREQRRAEEALNQAQEQLIRAQKMEAMGQLAAGVAHDFNNLLTVVQGYSDILFRQNRIDDGAKRLLKEIHKAGARGAALTRQLLIFSRREIVAPKVLDINAVVIDMEAMLRRLLGEDIILTTSLHPDLSQVKADPGHIGQIILNLAVNARDAMPQGGDLKIETADLVLDEDFAQAHLGAQPGRHVVLAVSDSGCGMTEEVKARLFEPYFTTKEIGKGTGLGLAIVYGIVKQGGGTILVDSQPDRGAMFRIYLPALDKELPSEQSAPGPRQAARGSETILLVEDEDAVRTLTQMILQTYGYTVLAAEGPAAALRLCKGHQETIHLLVTDLVMPGMGGRQLAERLATVRPRMKVLYLSGYTDDTVLRHGIRQEGVAFLQKPYAPDALALKVREVLDSQ